MQSPYDINHLQRQHAKKKKLLNMQKNPKCISQDFPEK